LSTPEHSGAQWKTTARVRSRSTASSQGSDDFDEPTEL
jgi:hypothetical protein